ncbi:S-adenosyl-L-methionine-dependent methyltransferase [Neohortaea acidophila]|uniref:Protein-lysine N-methyltransferase EFM4 n=1 Tax=Neohortaea acidophila TaxID=245834 RepID=A0A6A6Q297_9PEZI|nr:S-adenosyl-L-methionine-dependent methyltransferase [Neohortaea acidophila]KAF2486520.1 S-adenosyl-L-methionine-dependent methyltransferase [Neohortaea acidophila]
MDTNEPLQPSDLGTKEYWDELYTRESHNHAENEDDEGTIWFSESNAERVVTRTLAKLADHGFLSREGERASRFLDLGTGNGHMLFSLREDDDEDEGPWMGEMVGVDYSQTGIELARRIADTSTTGEALRFETWDLLTQDPGDWFQDGFDVVLDKGTFDAISLAQHDDGSSHPCEVYRDRVERLVRPGQFLLITSCNWTRDELVRWLAPDGSGELAFYDEAKYPTFMFGGKAGQSVVTVVFRRRAADPK